MPFAQGSTMQAEEQPSGAMLLVFDTPGLPITSTRVESRYSHPEAGGSASIQCNPEPASW